MDIHNGNKVNLAYYVCEPFISPFDVFLLKPVFEEIDGDFTTWLRENKLNGALDFYF